MMKIVNYLSVKTLNKQQLYELLVLLISYTFIFLFLYTASSKVLGFEEFKAEIGRSPLLTEYIDVVAFSVPAAEIIVALVLMVKRLLLPGLLASFGLMLIFIAYIFYIVIYTNGLPCQCGGVLPQLSWAEHLLFNIGFMGLAGIGAVLEERNNRTLRDLHNFNFP